MPSLEKSIVAAKKRSFEGVVDAGEERAGFALAPIMPMAEELVAVDSFMLEAVFEKHWRCDKMVLIWV